ncbi:MAG: hypothetical protein GY796_10085, partial [Chloroflexi bacterium]|nr:hypothetical protein [Chloroflexota bacterium]
MEPAITRRVWLFGPLRAENTAREGPAHEGPANALHIPPGHAQSLFAYLVLHPAPHPRERLADMLWPEAPPNRVGRNFSSLLYRLRKAVGEDWLIADEDQVAL